MPILLLSPIQHSLQHILTNEISFRNEHRFVFYDGKTKYNGKAFVFALFRCVLYLFVFFDKFQCSWKRLHSTVLWSESTHINCVISFQIIVKITHFALQIALDTPRKRNFKRANNILLYNTINFPSFHQWNDGNEFWSGKYLFTLLIGNNDSMLWCCARAPRDRQNHKHKRFEAWDIQRIFANEDINTTISSRWWAAKRINCKWVGYEIM